MSPRPMAGAAVFAATLLAAGWVPATAAASIPAPTGRHAAPASYFLLRLGGDLTEVRYTPGSLDRAANLQTRLELAARAFHKWADVDYLPELFVLNREEWQRAGYPVPYGLPLRIGARGVAAPAAGDDGTVALWRGLLGTLPSIQGVPLRGTPDQAATMLLADVFVQLQACEGLADQLGMAGDQPWVRDFVSHVVSLGLVARLEPARLQPLDDAYGLLAARHRPESRSARDLRPDLPLEDWLWFQAQLHRGARILLDEAGSGKDAVKRLRKLQKKGGGTLRAAALLERHERLRTWFHDSFSAVSLRAEP